MIDQTYSAMDPELRQYLEELGPKPHELDYEEMSECEKLSVEMIFRKTFKDTLKEYAQNCSLAGVQKMCDPRIGITERLIRVLVFLAAIAMSCYFLLYIWSNALTNPLIVSTESETYPIGEINFPAVSLCNVNRVSKKALKQMAKEEYPDLAKRREPIEEVEAMLLQWVHLLDFSYNDSLRKNPIYVNLIEKYLHQSHRVTNIMKRLAPSCEDQLLRCYWGGESVDCRTLFSMQRTSLGHCCTFNSITNYDSSGKIMRPVLEAKRQAEAGRFMGLVVVLDPMSDDFAYSLSSTTGYDIFLSSVINFADPKTGRVSHRKAEPNVAMFLELKSTKQVAAPEVRKYGLNTRNCLFLDEQSDIYNNMYSYSLCIIYCRVQAIQSLCKCTPYIYALENEKSICTLDHLRCLNKYKDKFNYLYPKDVKDPSGLEMEMQNSLFCEDCYPDCELTAYSIKSYSTPIQSAYDTSKNYRNEIFSSVNLTNKVMISIDNPTQDAILDRLDVVSYWYEIVSNVGGFMGIVIGFSVISVVEIIYFFTFRFTHHLFVNYLEYH